MSKRDETSTIRVTRLTLYRTDGLCCEQAQLVDFVTQSLNFCLEVHDASNPFDADTFSREFGDPAKTSNVGVAVSAIATSSTSRLQETASLVDAQCL
ncbi:MAG: hypothetical protein RLZ37_1220, partial [Actinomycetota bacterium]